MLINWNKKNTKTKKKKSCNKHDQKYAQKKEICFYCHLALTQFHRNETETQTQMEKIIRVKSSNKMFCIQFLTCFYVYCLEFFLVHFFCNTNKQDETKQNNSNRTNWQWIFFFDFNIFINEFFTNEFFSYFNISSKFIN